MHETITALLKDWAPLIGVMIGTLAFGGAMFTVFKYGKDIYDDKYGSKSIDKVKNISRKEVEKLLATKPKLEKDEPKPSVPPTTGDALSALRGIRKSRRDDTE